MSAYDTVINRPLAKSGQAALNAIELMAASPAAHRLVPLDDNDQRTRWSIVGISVDEDIPAFPHPIPSKNNETVYVDLRSYYRPNGKVADYLGRNNIIILADIVGLWEDDPTVFSGLATVMAVSYATWVARALNSNYRLTPMDEAAIRLVAAVFFAAKFERHLGLLKGYVDTDAASVIRRIAQTKELYAQTVYLEDVMASEHFESYINLDTEEDQYVPLMLSAIKDVLELSSGARLNTLKSVDFMNIMSYGWMGADGRAISQTAIEYIPYVAYMCKMSDELSVAQRNTRFGQAYSSISRGNLSDVVKRF